jgi:5-(carboxyamino)imidazole ribonucleotide synthase
MFCMAAQSLGYKVALLDPEADVPAASVAHRHITADHLDAAALDALASCVSGATTEFENVPAAALDHLARTARVAPRAASVAIAQDRVREKAFLDIHGFAVAPFRVIEHDDDVSGIDPQLLPGIVKSARLGYDGKGQVRVRTLAEVERAFAALGRQPCVFEQFLALELEVSVLVARDQTRRSVTWPVVENRHRDGILDVSIAPARIAPELEVRARDIATRIAAALDYHGVMCVEFFLTKAGDLLVNEIAPRPHNSGHFTIDACVTSQFEQQARVLAGLPLGDTHQHTPAAMVNLLGDIWYADETAAVAREPDWSAVLAHPRAKLHLYGKTRALRGRKMGHVTCLGSTLDEALATAQAVRRTLRIPGAERL